MESALMTINTILYCEKWEQTVRFYRDGLHLPVLFATDWFVEFRLNEQANLSIADVRRASIAAASGRGLTLTWQVQDLDATWQELERAGLDPTPIRDHPWQARVCHIHDPEGHRIEFWEARPD